MKKFFDKKIKFLFSTSLLSLILFLVVIREILTNSFLAKFDIFINESIKLLWNPALTLIMAAITNIMSPLILTLLSLVLVIFLMIRKKHLNSVVLVSAILLGLALEIILKVVIERIRPADHLVAVTGYSFPSGHATIATIFFSMLIYSLKDQIKDKVSKTIFITASIGIAILIGLSRIYLSVHWFSDILGGFLLGSFIVALTIISLKVYIKETRA